MEVKMGVESSVTKLRYIVEIYAFITEVYCKYMKKLHLKEEKISIECYFTTYTCYD